MDSTFKCPYKLLFKLPLYNITTDCEIRGGCKISKQNLSDYGSRFESSKFRDYYTVKIDWLFFLF